MIFFFCFLFGWLVGFYVISRSAAFFPFSFLLLLVYGCAGQISTNKNDQKGVSSLGKLTFKLTIDKARLDEENAPISRSCQPGRGIDQVDKDSNLSSTLLLRFQRSETKKNQ